MTWWPNTSKTRCSALILRHLKTRIWILAWKPRTIRWKNQPFKSMELQVIALANRFSIPFLSKKITISRPLTIESMVLLLFILFIYLLLRSEEGNEEDYHVQWFSHSEHYLYCLTCLELHDISVITEAANAFESTPTHAVETPLFQP